MTWDRPAPTDKTLYFFMKDLIMKTIFENADYKQATEQLTQLSEAHAAAMFEETALLGQINRTPEGKPSALERAKAYLTGSAPLPRQDTAGLQQRLDNTRQTIALLGDAIKEQRQVMAALVQAQSATVNAAQREPHIRAAQGIRTALAGLRDAMQAEQATRAEIAAGGFMCNLEPLERPTLNQSDPESELGRFERDIAAYLLRCDIEAKKSVNVRLLVDNDSGRLGDVLSLPGTQAAGLVHLGHGELTSDKPRRAPAQPTQAEAVFMA